MHGIVKDGAGEPTGELQEMAAKYMAYRAAGVELAAVLSDEQAVVVERVETSTRSRLSGLLDRQQPAPVHAAIQGEFRGWAVGSVIALDNDQRWRVTEGELYLGKPIAHAQATITPGMVSGWYLQVAGQSPRAKVRRLP